MRYGVYIVMIICLTASIHLFSMEMEHNHTQSTPVKTYEDKISSFKKKSEKVCGTCGALTCGGGVATIGYFCLPVNSVPSMLTMIACAVAFGGDGMMAGVASGRKGGELIYRHCYPEAPNPQSMEKNPLLNSNK